MSVAKSVESRLNRFPKGYVFTYKDFPMVAENREAIIKAVNRMVKSGRIAKMSKGKFYRPETSPFGKLRPRDEQIVKDLLENNGKVTGYLTGYSIYNKLGLTTQVSNTIQIGKNQTRPNFKRERFTISVVVQKNVITKENIPLLQILDCLKFIKKIPDTTIDTSCKRLLALIKELSAERKSVLVRLAQKYPPVTRALLGGLMEKLNENENAVTLLKTLNPISAYKLQGGKNLLRLKSKWNIIWNGTTRG